MQIYHLLTSSFDCIVNYQSSDWCNRYAAVAELDSGFRHSQSMTLAKLKPLEPSQDDWFAMHHSGSDLSGFVCSIREIAKQYTITSIFISEKARLLLTRKELAKLSKIPVLKL